MSLLNKIRTLFHDDWCDHCQQPMQLERKQLYALPTIHVGHYSTHDDPNFYVHNMYKVQRKSDIPTGTYACGTYIYHCPHCDQDVAKLTVFLPVRDQEQVEESFLFDNQKLLDFLRS